MENITDMEKFDERSEGKLIVVDDVNSPFAMTKLGLAHGQSLADIEKMLELQIKWEENEAKKAYFDAVAKFKKNPPIIKKDKYNKQFDSWYASIGSLLGAVSTPLGEVGLSISFPTPKQDDKSMTVECKLSHRLGYSESTSMTGPILAGAIGKVSGQSSRNPIQDIKTTFTYLRSATCEAILGLAGTDASLDDDGNAAGGTVVEYITLDQQTEINDYFDVLYTDNGKKFLKWLGAESVDTIPIKDYKKAVNSLKDIKAERKKSKREPGDED